MAVTQDRASARAGLINGYLAPQNLASMGSGCPVAALAVDVAREAEDKPVRLAFLQGLEQLIALLADEQPDADGAAAREAALGEIPTMVGSLVLARATKGHVLSGEIMASARRRLLADD